MQTDVDPLALAKKKGKFGTRFASNSYLKKSKLVSTSNEKVKVGKKRSPRANSIDIKFDPLE